MLAENVFRMESFPRSQSGEEKALESDLDNSNSFESLQNLAGKFDPEKAREEVLSSRADAELYKNKGERSQINEIVEKVSPRSSNGEIFIPFGIADNLEMLDSETKKKLSEQLDKIIIDNPKQKNGEVYEVLASYTANYTEGIDDSFADLISKKTEEYHENHRFGELPMDIQCLERSQSTKYAKEYFECSDQLQTWDERHIFRCYVGLHGLNETKVRGFSKNVIPFFENNDDGVIFGNVMGGTGRPGTYGIVDYELECCMTEVKPDEINRLVRINNEIPTSNYEKFLQNRDDSERLESVLFPSRKFVHDELPGAHAALKAMEAYYDNRGSEESKDKMIEAFHEMGLSCSNDFQLNLEAYDSMVKGNEHGFDNEEDEKAIDIIRRLVKNTEPAPLDIPVTGIEEIDEAINKINPIINEQTGEVRVSMSEMADSVSAINLYLLNNQGEVGINPAVIDAINYVDKTSAYALRGLNKKELNELMFEPTFKDVLLFSQLTSSASYNDLEFNRFYEAARRKSGDAYNHETVNEDDIRESFRMIHKKVIENVSKLSDEYSKKPETKRFSKAIWSGNLTNELLKLFERV